MYNTMRTAKLKDARKITSASAHNFRIRGQGNIDPSRSQNNQVLLNSLGADLTISEGLQRAITAHYNNIGAKVNKNSVMAQEFVISASPEFFKKLDDKEVKNWAEHQLEFMKQEFGDNVKVAVLHLDEKTPHLHFMLTCDEKKVKAFKNRHGECSREKVSLNANRWNPDFLTGLHTRHAVHNQRYGLKRGLEGSKATHKPVKQYYAELRKLKQSLENRGRELEMMPELVGIVDVLAEAIEGLDPPNQKLARVARFAANIARQARGAGAPQTPQKPRLGV